MVATLLTLVSASRTLAAHHMAKGSGLKDAPFERWASVPVRSLMPRG